jgi:riboflavin kinase/FMN adenylyltransferase
VKIYKNLDEADFSQTAVTVGIFDGLHRGHRVILDKLKQEAHKLNAESLVFTLYPHPKVVFSKTDENLSCLMTQHEKIAALRNLGIDHLVIYPFSKAFASYTAFQFTKEILYKKLNAKRLVVGYDHKFGSDQLGDLDVLNKYAHAFDFSAVQAPKFREDGRTVSSSLIRKLLLGGQLEAANKYLGYAYRVWGEVVRGDQIGRSIGFPTANLQVEPNKLLPRNGVYAVKVFIDGTEHKGMLNIGLRPTINKSDCFRTEVHILDYSADLYGKQITLELHARIRNEKRFANLKALKVQLEVDKENVQQCL